METEISRQEQELEERSLAAMFEARANADPAEWISGPELVEKTTRYIKEHGDEIMAVIDEYRDSTN